MKELINFRNRREKHFLNPDGTITAKIYDEDIHCLKNGKWVDIDNTLVDKGKYFINKINSFNAIFNKNSNDLFEVKKDQYYLKFICKNHTNLKLEKIHEKIKYLNTAGKIDFIYELKNNKLKESIVLNCIDTIPDTLDFEIDTNLKLSLQENGSIHALDNNSDIVFLIDKPYMLDSNMSRNDNIKYDLITTDRYTLKLKLDLEWLKNAKFPVMIDPTIINGVGDNVQDTYISNVEPDRVFDGVEHLRLGSNNEGIFRILLKFGLPTIGTGCTIVEAKAFLKTGDRVLNSSFDAIKPIDVHNINTPWDETTATWNNMHDKYDEKIETWTQAEGHDIYDLNAEVYTDMDLTNIVKSWYAGQPNNGIMLKLDDEVVENPELLVYSAFSKTYDIHNGTTNRPYLLIKYLYQNGILPYIDYNDIGLTSGRCSINNFNGNITNIFDVNRIINSKIPFALSVVYNSCDMILSSLNDIAKGWKLSVYETIQKDDELNYLLYIDENSSIHYFYETEKNNYKDEEGLNLSISFENEKYTLLDGFGNKKIFELIAGEYRYVKLIDTSENEMNIEYDNDHISKIKIDDDEIAISYSDTQILVKGTSEEAIININLSKQVSSIKSNMGTVSFEYNEFNLISKMVDNLGVIYQFEYINSIPYRLSKVSLFGTNGTKLKELNYSYGYLTTTIEDSNQMKKVYTFNNYGNTLGTVIYNYEDNNFDDAYGFSQTFIDDQEGNNKNNLSSLSLPIRYIKNLIDDSSFEQSDKNAPNSTRVAEEARTGKYSCKINGEYDFVYNINKTSFYTFSFYIKTACNGILKLCKNLNGVITDIENKKILLNEDNEYQRYYITGEFEENSQLLIQILLDNNGVAYIDDLQLEEGKVVNDYNLVDNSNFSNDFDGWKQSNCQLLTLSNGINAVKLDGVPLMGGSSLSKILKIQGKEGDCYRLSFWYKNEGVLETSYEFLGNMANIAFYTDDEGSGSGTTNLHLNRHATEWQFFSGYFTAPSDYKELGINIFSSGDANSFYVTNVMLNKESLPFIYEYDENGNLIQKSDTNGNIIDYVYNKNNQLIRKHFNNATYYREYDRNVVDRVINSYGPNGFKIEKKYDENGNVIAENITNVYFSGDVDEEAYYYLRLRGTNKYLRYNLSEKNLSLETNNCNHTSFKFKKMSGDLSNYYKIVTTNKKVSFDDLMNVFLTNYDDKETECDAFELMKNEDGSIKFKSEKFNKILTYEENHFLLKDDENLDDQCFYLENINTKLKIVNQTVYDENGKYVTKTIDDLGKVTTYEINEQNGENNKIISPRGVVTTNDYNNKGQLVSTSKSGKTINYEYYENDLLKKITTNNESYIFIYDEMARLKNVKMNEISIVTNEYDANNLITGIKYPNGNMVSNVYDKFGRIINKNISGKDYNVYYNSLGLLSKVEGSEETYDYIFDRANRLCQFVFNNNLMVNYKYSDGNLSKREIIYDDKKYQVEYKYNENGNPTMTIIDSNIETNIIYDDLQRKMREDINGRLPVEYSYMSNGNNTSLMLKSIKLNNDLYEYTYDDDYNITEIKKNNKLKSSYKYDDFNQLIMEIDYSLNQKIKYKYDGNGNILYKLVCKMDDTIITKRQYFYENENWKDQLTKVDDDVIEYDAMGNIISYRDNFFTYINGTQIETANNKDGQTIKYEYNYDGQLSRKIKKNSVTEYFYSGDTLLLEKRNNNMLYYIYDSDYKLLGLKYNNDIYYYQRNVFDDIIGIYDCNFKLVACYEYDSWGNLLSIKDASENIILDDNNIGNVNPFRYRGYYYDTDLDLYIFQERYYNPNLGRFINIDKQLSENMLGLNLYIYCGNNPISRYDDDGKALLYILGVLAGGVVGGAINTTLKVTSNLSSGKKWNEDLKETVIEGVSVGALTVATGGNFVVATAYTSGVKNVCKESAKYISGEKEPTMKNLVNSTIGVLGDVATDTILTKVSDGLGNKIAKKIGLSDVGRKAKSIFTSLFGKKARKKYTVDYVKSSIIETGNIIKNAVVNKLTDMINSFKS